VGRHLAPILFLVACAWVVLLLAAPLLPAPVAASAYAIGSLICHQRPERSFHLANTQLPVCARCLGIYGGAAVGTVFALGRVSIRRPAAVMIVGAIPTVVTLAVEWTGVLDPGNTMRALSGIVLGATVAAVVVTLHYDECAPRRPIASRPPPTRI
jgi:uncharacterized membrane protein